jgi:hypothetical protein
MLKYSIRETLGPFIRDILLKSGAYIVLKELNQDPDSIISWEILSQVKSVLSRLV